MRDQADLETIQVLRLIEGAGLRSPCDLDLLLFFVRHPRVVLGSDQLASYVGYEIQHVERALHLLLGGRLLKRTLNQGATGRMYVLAVDDAAAWVEPVRRLCATPDGRHALRTLLREQRPQGPSVNGRGQHG
jgi:hypothetical protein